MAPIKFNKVKKERYAKVIVNLKTIRDAEIANAEVNRRFTANPQTLVSFIDTAQFAITEIKNINTSYYFPNTCTLLIDSHFVIAYITSVRWKCVCIHVCKCVCACMCDRVCV